MVIYRGFSTQFNNLPAPSLNPPGIDGGQVTRPVVPVKKFSLYDDQLVIVDFLNALNIPQGQKPGKPEYGTTIWSFIFEPNIPEVQIQIENEIRRIAGLDPRLIINTVIIYPYDSGFLAEMELAIAPENKVQQLQLNFDRNSGTVTSS